MSNVIPFPPTQQEKLEAMLEEVVPGAKHLRCAYRITRGGKEVIVPLEELTHEECGAISKGLRAQALKHEEDANLLSAELERREGQR
jgi:hypothetical protein